MLGAWATDAAMKAKLAKQWAGAKPFPHAVIPKFFSEEGALKMAKEFPQPTWGTWDVYDNPFEGEHAKWLRRAPHCGCHGSFPVPCQSCSPTRHRVRRGCLGPRTHPMRDV